MRLHARTRSGHVYVSVGGHALPPNFKGCNMRMMHGADTRRAIVTDTDWRHSWKICGAATSVRCVHAAVKMASPNQQLRMYLACMAGLVGLCSNRDALQPHSTYPYALQHSCQAVHLGGCKSSSTSLQGMHETVVEFPVRVHSRPTAGAFEKRCQHASSCQAEHKTTAS